MDFFAQPTWRMRLLGLQATAHPTTAGVLTPYWSPTPTKTLQPAEPGHPAAHSGTPSPTVPPPPTATPFTYQVKKGDTFLAIAFQHGISVDDLQSANPEVDPRMMPVDTLLVIPILESADGLPPTAVSTPTPYPVEVGEAKCYPAADTSIWCYAVVYNNHSQPIENVSAWMNLLSADGEIVTGTEAILPLNIVPPGEALPLSGYFPASESNDEQDSVFALVELRSAIPVAGDAARYLPVKVKVEEELFNASRQQATIRGQVVLDLEGAPPAATRTLAPDSAAPEGTPAAPTETAVVERIAKRVWVGIIAYAKDGSVVGVRKWEAGKALKPGKKVEFETTVYSLGPAIERIEVLVEARP